MNAEYTEHVYQEYHYKGYEPIHQREEIVRCRDCKHSDKGYWCRYFGKYGDLSTVEPDGFCAWGERKVVGE